MNNKRALNNKKKIEKRLVAFAHILASIDLIETRDNKQCYFANLNHTSLYVKSVFGGPRNLLSRRCSMLVIIPSFELLIS
jgi:hypothetical protein